MQPDDEVVIGDVGSEAWARYLEAERRAVESMNAHYEMLRRVKTIIFAAVMFGLGWVSYPFWRWLWQFL